MSNSDPQINTQNGQRSGRKQWVKSAAILAAIGLCMFLFLASAVVESWARTGPRSLNAAEMTVLTETGRRIGSPEAPVSVIFFLSLSCTFSKQTYEDLVGLLETFPEHLNIVVHYMTREEDAAEDDLHLGVECAAEQEMLEEYAVAAYQNARVQRYWNAGVAIADSAGVGDMNRFRECLSTRQYLQSLMEDAKWVEELGLIGTPTLFINGVPITGSPPLDDLRTLIEDAIADAE